MTDKNLPVYYVTILWIVAIVSVFFILKPMGTSVPRKNEMSNISDFTITQDKNEVQGKIDDNSSAAGNNKEQSIDVNNGNDLIFYDKTAFIRYFSDKYSEEELTDSYNKALDEKSNIAEKAPIRVQRKNLNGKTRKTFSGSFDIRPVPGNTNQ